MFEQQPRGRAMTSDQERWAEVLMYERQHGSDALRWVAERIGFLLLAGDHAGVQHFRQIAIRVERLQRAGSDPKGHGLLQSSG